MRSTTGIALLALALGACAPSDRLEETVSPVPTGPSFARNKPVHGGPADMIVDAARLASSWTITTQTILASDCDAQEGDVPTGTHRLLRFTVSTPNAGTGDVAVGDPRHHYYVLNDGLFEFASCHDHFHYRNYARYELVSLADGATFLSAKRGFCLVDDQRYYFHWKAQFTACGTKSFPGNQGITAGWSDVYVSALPGQYFVLDDARNPVPPGDYVIRVTVNPPFACTEADSLRPRDGAGMCHNFAEGDYGNNVGEARVTIR